MIDQANALESNLRTGIELTDESLFEVVLRDPDGQRVSVSVHTADVGIAVVEAYLHLRRENPAVTYYAEIAKYTFNVPLWRGNTKKIDMISNELLANYLTVENKLLVACFISRCNYNDPAADLEQAEERLLERELNCNRVNGELYLYDYTKDGGALLTVADIKDRYRSIWKSFIFVESMDFGFAADRDYYSLSEGPVEAEELLFWTYLLGFYGLYDCFYPYTLYLYIKKGTFDPYLTYGKYPELMGCIVL